MKRAPLRLPWTSETVPHAVLDIVRGCNIRCRDCYNRQSERIKPLEEIKAELDALMGLRRLHSVSLVGGEITQHPQLVEIVQLIRQRGLFVELFTNGLKLDDKLCTRLKDAGANVIFLHIETAQLRPDLPDKATAADLQHLREQKVALVAAHGMEAGLAITAYPDKPGEVEEAVAFTLTSPHVCYLLVTWWRDVGRMPAVAGNIDIGMFSHSLNSSPFTCREVRPAQLYSWLAEKFGIAPFAMLGSNRDTTEPRWVSFLTATIYQPRGLTQQCCLLNTWVERVFLRATRKLTGRYPFYQRQNARLTGLHLLLNGLAEGIFWKRLKFLSGAIRPGSKLNAKRLLFQWPAEVDESGRVVHCEYCPDAVLKKGQLVPLCISDLVV